MSNDSQTHDREGLCYDDAGSGSDSSPSGSFEDSGGSPPVIQRMEEERRRKNKNDARTHDPRMDEATSRGGVPPSSSSAGKKSAKKGSKKSSEAGEKAPPRQSRSVDGYRSLSTEETVAPLGFPPSFEIRIPSRKDRPWTPPAGFVCVHEAFFREGRLFCPFPRPLVDFCFRKGIALAQLTPLAVLNIVGLIVFGAEVGMVVSANFLERSVTLVANSGTPGTFYAQIAGGSPVTGKPSKALGDGTKGDWQDYYFFLKATPAVMGAGAPQLRTDFNREIGVTRKDKRVGPSGAQEKVIARMLIGVEREYKLLDKKRLDRQRAAIEAIPWASTSSRDARNAQPANPPRKPKKKAKKVALTVDVGETPSLVERLSLSEGQSSGVPPRSTQGGKSPSLLRRMEEEEKRKRSRDVSEMSEEDEGSEDDSLPLADRRIAKKSRKECLEVVERKAEEKRRKEALQRAGGRSGASASVGTSTERPDVLGAFRSGDDATEKHHFAFEYRGPCPIVEDPSACAELLDSIPEVEEETSEFELQDPERSYGEMAAAHVVLMSLGKRRERVHQREVCELRRTIELHEQKRKELEDELEAEKVRSHTRGTELTAGFRQAEKLRLRVGELERDLGRREEELVARAREVEEGEEKLRGVGGLCRRRMKKALKDQLALFKVSCREQSQNAVAKVQGYLQARGKWEKADRLLSQAKGAKQLAEGLQEDGVSIPDATLARLVEEEAKCIRERAALEVEGLSSDDFEFNLPSNLGIPDINPLDFGPGILSCLEDRPEGPSEGSEEEEEGEGEDPESPREETENEREVNVDSGGTQRSDADLAGGRDVAQEFARASLHDEE